jgi:hypothetical protein
LNGDQLKTHDWIEIQITFKTLCTECQKEVPPGRAFWSSSQKAARHLACNRATSLSNDKRSLIDIVAEKSDPSDVTSGYEDHITELKCFICGYKTGCSKCEHLVDCQQRLVSKYCICYQCMIGQQDPFNGYQECFAKKSKHLK